MSDVERKYPFIKVNTEAIALGIIDMFSDEEKAIVRFGMLPAKKIEILETELRNKLKNSFKWDGQSKEVNIYFRHDEPMPWFERFGDDGFVMRDVDLNQVHRDIIHEITLKIYSNVDMLV